MENSTQINNFQVDTSQLESFSEVANINESYNLKKVLYSS